ncbi:MAG: MarR family transcriptional regulator [Alloprevotella sp.]|nr:MarR family transcriptional regulator [Alloprevotella sp.]
MAHNALLLKNQLCFRLYTASRLFSKTYAPFMQSLGITYPQYLVLMVLWEEDAQTVNTIAKRLLLETNTVTPLLKRMEQAGLVRRVRDRVDERRRIVSLTPAGRALEEKAAGMIPSGMLPRFTCTELKSLDYTRLYADLDALIGELSK